MIADARLTCQIVYSPIRRGSSFTRKHSAGSNSLPQMGDKALGAEETFGYASISKLTTELDRVPEHVLKEYEKQVLMHRDISDQAWLLSQKSEGRRSKIVRHHSDAARRDYMSEFDHYEACYTMKRNLFPEGFVGAKPKPRFGIEVAEPPTWNRGSKKQGFNFTRGRPGKSNSSRADADDD